MLKWTPYPFIRFSLALISGILIGDGGISLNPFVLCLLIGILWVIYIFLGKIMRGHLYFQFNSLIGFLGILILILFGALRSASTHDNIQKQVLKHPVENILHYSASIESHPIKKGKYIRFEAQIHRIHAEGIWHRCDTKVFMYYKSNSDDNKLTYGDKLIVSGHPTRIETAGNPYTFDYSKWMYRKRILYQDFTDSTEVRVYDNNPSSYLIGYSIKLRTDVDIIIDKNIQDPRLKGIVSSLLIGLRVHLDPEIARDYSRSGVFHILAVSGLHVGIIYFLVLFIFGRLNNTKTGRWIFAILVILIMTFYVLITGMSPSVKRAATMLALIPLSKAINRQTNIFNTIAFSAFIHLLFDPFLLFSVGFQLSYIAVIGIVLFFNPIYNLITFNSMALNWIWKLWSVSLAAQISTFPLTIHYFNQFPVVFLLSNLIMIPVAFFTIVLGFLMVTTNSFTWLSQLISFIIQWVLEISSIAIHGLNVLQGDLFSSIHLSTFETFLLSGFTICMTALFISRKITFAHLGLVVIMIFSLNRIVWLKENSNGSRLMVYHSSGNYAIEMIDELKGLVLTENHISDDSKILQNLLYPVARNMGRTTRLYNVNTIRQFIPVIEKPGFILFIWKGHKILLVRNAEKLPDYLNSIPLQVMIIQRQPYISLQKVIRKFKADYVIITGWINQDVKKEILEISLKNNIDITYLENNGYAEIRF